MAIEKAEIRELLQNILKQKSSDKVYELFGKLGYTKLLTKDTKRQKSSFGFRKEESTKINNIYSILNYGQDLNVFLIESETDSNSFIRSVFNTLDSEYLAFMVVITTDYSKLTFVLPKTNSKENNNKKLTKLETNLSDIKYTDLDILDKITCVDESNYRKNWFNWQDAFNVEKVTDKFFCDYKSKFFELRDYLIKNKINPKDAHEFTLQFLNRIMFIYFISKKGWLKETNFFKWYIAEYKTSQRITSRKDEFYELWIKQLFFKGLNNRHTEIKGLPKPIIDEIKDFPYLNGGLFRENELDKTILVNIKDKLFEDILYFFESYNFTIKEDMPLDEQVAIDPQMIGYVYESLAQVADKVYNPEFNNNDLGIFYTPKVEVDFMCRRSIVEYLANNCPDISKENFYHFVFDGSDITQISKWLNNKSCEKVESKLDEVSIVDPACGSGAFLVGALNVLSELYNKLNKFKKDKNDLTEFQLKKRIIQYSLYGVDVMPWAIHAAELRLWLQLVLDAKKEELTEGPLLPNLDLNLRVGDSLVQEIGDIYFNINSNNLKPELRKKIDALKNEKRKYFENSNLKKYSDSDKIKQEELKLFKEIIDDKIQELKENLSKDNTTSQKTLTGMVLLDPVAQKKKEEIFFEVKKLNKIKDALKEPENKPFIWDLDFAEIFSEKHGFDIVIGNPPYVRQEAICPPGKLEKDITKEDKQKYKEKLQKSLKERFDGYLDKLSGQSDLYVYFYLHGLGLLNNKGTFCFITSNSWLDVNFGTQLQEFLCKYVPIKAIYDNPKRSFSHAAVNTVITLFGAPTFQDIYYIGSLKSQQQDFKDSRQWPLLSHAAKFIMFKKSFEEVVNTTNLLNIESIAIKEKEKPLSDLIKNVVKTDDYRIFPILQQDLLEDGWECPEDEDKTNYSRFNIGQYEGNKWGGKFLRAPDIFFTILERGKDKFEKLSKVGILKRGVTTGVNNFFYISKKDLKEHNIEKEFLKLAIVSPRYCESILIKEKDIPYFVFLCKKDKPQLKGTNALKYIEWGEKQKLNKSPSLINNKKWYSLKENADSDIILYKHIGDKEYPLRNNGYFVNNVFYEFSSYNKKDTNKILNYLSSSLVFLFQELQGQVGLGEGALVLKVPDWKKLPLIKVNFNNEQFYKRAITPIYTELGINLDKNIREQDPKPLPDRAELDNIIFDELGLTKQERKEVYWSICELIKQRIGKANSFKDSE